MDLVLQIGEELNKLIFELEKVAQVKVKPNMAILSLICNVERTSEILMRTFKVFIEEGISVSMMSQGASKVCAGFVWVGLTRRGWGGWWGGGGRGRCTSEILMRTFKVFIEEGISVSMMSQGASKVSQQLSCITESV